MLSFLKALLRSDDAEVATFHVALVVCLGLLAVPLILVCVAALAGWRLPEQFAETVRACGEALAAVIAACGGAWYLKGKNGQ